MGRLVLTRKSGESILIGDIEVTVKRKSAQEWKVVIDAPEDVLILRKELRERMEDEE